MPPAFRAAQTTNANAGSGVAPTLTLPTYQPGDLLVLLVSSTNIGPTAPTYTTPAGWTSVGQFGSNDRWLTVWRKIAASGEAAPSLAHQPGQSYDAAASIVSFSGVHQATPIATTGAASSSAVYGAGTFTALSLAAAKVGNLLLALVGTGGGGGVVTAMATPTGMTQRTFLGQAPAAQAGSGVALFDEPLVATGATGNRVGVITPSGTSWNAIMLEIAGAGPKNRMIVG